MTRTRKSVGGNSADSSPDKEATPRRRSLRVPTTKEETPSGDNDTPRKRRSKVFKRLISEDSDDDFKEETPKKKMAETTPKRTRKSTPLKKLVEAEAANETPKAKRSRKSIVNDDIPLVENGCTPKKAVRTPSKSTVETPTKSLKTVTPSKRLPSTPTAKQPKSEAVAAKKVITVTVFEDDVDKLMQDINTYQVVSRKKRKASVAPNLDDVTEGSTEDDDEDTRETLSMYGKYGKVMGRSTTKESSVPAFGFATPKKRDSMIERTNLILSASKKTPVSKLLERQTPSKRKILSAPTTPTSTKKADTPLRRLRLTGDAPETPKTVRKKISKEIEKEVAEEDESSSEEETSDDDEEDDEDLGVQPIDDKDVELPKKSKRPRKEALVSVNTDDYFERQGSSKIVTSDKTLNQLKTPRLSPEALKSILDGEPLKYESEIKKAVEAHREMFPKWMHLLCEDFSVVLYGLGSKQQLLSDFQARMLHDKDCVVVNGFFPSLTIKHVLSAILNDILDYKGTTGASQTEQAESILKAYASDDVVDDLFIIVHNIDGPMLRNDTSQTILSRLAGHPKIHIICSVDHINAPLLWDQHKLSKFNFIWHDATTFLPYTEETLNENSLMVRSGGGNLALHSLLRVFESLTPNAKEIYLLIVNYQLKAVEEEGFAMYQGLSFKDLYRQCRPAFLVNSDLTLRAQLTEFIDHKLIRSKKGPDGMEYLVIPLENATLLEFLEKYKATS